MMPWFESVTGFMIFIFSLFSELWVVEPNERNLMPKTGPSELVMVSYY